MLTMHTSNTFKIQIVAFHHSIQSHTSTSGCNKIPLLFVFFFIFNCFTLWRLSSKRSTRILKNWETVTFHIKIYWWMFDFSSVTEVPVFWTLIIGWGPTSIKCASNVDDLKMAILLSNTKKRCTAKKTNYALIINWGLNHNSAMSPLSC